MKDKAAGGAHAAPHAIEVVRWDAAVGGFVRLVIDHAGKILARADLDPAVRRATLRYLLETHLTRPQRASLYRLLRAAGVLAPVARGEVVSMSSKVEGDAAEALAREVGVTLRDLLLLGWVVVYVVNRPGVRVPPLEDIEPDFAWLPPTVPGNPPPYFCAETCLDQLEEEAPSANASWSP